jgi:hypothetical protein
MLLYSYVRISPFHFEFTCGEVTNLPNFSVYALAILSYTFFLNLYPIAHAVLRPDELKTEPPPGSTVYKSTIYSDFDEILHT